MADASDFPPAHADVDTTWDGLQIAGDEPIGASVVVRRPSRGGHDYLLLHRAHEGPDYAGDWAWTSPAGYRRPGEPIVTGAERELVEETGIAGADVRAVDLSGRWAVFAADIGVDVRIDLVDPEHDRYDWLPPDEAMARISPHWVGREQIGRVERSPVSRIGFRPMTRADLPAVAERLTAPHVARWYGRESEGLDYVRDHYGPSIDGVRPTRMWVFQLDGVDAGQIQDYRARDYREFAELTGMPDAVGIDYAITDAALVSRGVGTAMIFAFVRDVVLPTYRGLRHVVSTPEVANGASVRVLEKAGFAPSRTVYEDGHIPQRMCVLDVARVFG
ncbi:MAG: GNAT family N-acetyltransferase [Nocardioidaceae bacterium]